MLSLQSSLAWVSQGYDGDVYAGGVYDGGGSYHPWAFVVGGVLGTAFVAGVVALVAYLRRSRVVARRSLVVACFAALPAVVPALIGAFAYRRLRNERSA
ncbi:hypothetical protein KOI35_44885 [Actinoplanes bogorensis]|uniref:Uncharacterized protein n=1 Tax=Paractinoplanes bogorensis TaxID=1610840 RepID=A0ABS5Z4P7_9ACTN|nr:hypothetical protein [Actinoplanes bogorensis]MBU2670660.1 hypothetical protein [Actinoplanes bogorensis]